MSSQFRAPCFKRDLSGYLQRKFKVHRADCLRPAFLLGILGTLTCITYMVPLLVSHSTLYGSTEPDYKSPLQHKAEAKPDQVGF
jgi:hypothetical protein